MASIPDRPSSSGGSFGRQSAAGRSAARRSAAGRSAARRSAARRSAARRQAVRRHRAVRFDPATGLSRLLLGQGLAWLLLAIAGLTVWFAALLRELSLTGGQALFWAGLELLAIAIAAGVGAAEVGMACRILGGPKLVVTMTGRFQGTMLAVALIVGAVLVMAGGSLLELMALGKLARVHPGKSCASG
jgi:hypothetical protein